MRHHPSCPAHWRGDGKCAGCGHRAPLVVRVLDRQAARLLKAWWTMCDLIVRGPR